MDKKVNLSELNEISVKILGTKYTIKKAHEEPDIQYMLDQSCSGFCRFATKEILFFDHKDEVTFTWLKGLNQIERLDYLKSTIRHEIVHAYLYESGLDSSSDSSSSWARHEEMIDWISLQSHKIYKTYKKLGILA